MVLPCDQNSVNTLARLIAEEISIKHQKQQRWTAVDIHKKELRKFLTDHVFISVMNFVRDVWKAPFACRVEHFLRQLDSNRIENETENRSRRSVSHLHAPMNVEEEVLALKFARRKIEAENHSLHAWVGALTEHLLRPQPATPAAAHNYQRVQDQSSLDLNTASVSDNGTNSRKQPREDVEPVDCDENFKFPRHSVGLENESGVAQLLTEGTIDASEGAQLGDTPDGDSFTFR